MSRPNVLWVFVDQLRWHALSCHGEVNVATPRLDRLAREGVTCERAISPVAVCTPARGCVMTGQWAVTTGIRYLGDILLPTVQTVAHDFRAAGYRTGYVGKWHLASAQNPDGHNEGAEFWVHPWLRGGFEDWAGFELSNHFWRTRYCDSGQMWPPKVLEGYQTDGLTNLTLGFLESRSADPDTPWFHVCSLEAPHHGAGEDGNAGCEVDGIFHTRHPAPAAYEARFRPGDIALRGNVPAGHGNAARSQQAQYCAMIANLDDNVGRLLDWLDASGQGANTLVVFFSDHGEMGGSHGRFQKCVPYAESLRVPLIFRLPGTIPGGRSLPDPVSLVDLRPSCAGLCGLPVAPEVQGVDLSSRLRGDGETPVREGVISQWFGNPRYSPTGDLAEEWRSVTTATHTYVRWESRGGMLFDHRADPLEMENRFDDPACAETRAHLQRLLEAELLRAGEPLPEFVRDNPSEKVPAARP